MWIKIQRRHRDTQYDRYTIPHSSYKSESKLHSKPDPYLMSSCRCPCEARLRLSNGRLKTFASLQLVCEWWRSASQCNNLFLQLHNIVNQQQGHSEWQTTDIELVTKSCTSDDHSHANICYHFFCFAFHYQLSRYLRSSSKLWAQSKEWRIIIQVYSKARREYTLSSAQWTSYYHML